MDLFLETPQQKADRILRQQERLLEMQAQVAADPYGGAGDRGAGAFAGGAGYPSTEGRYPSSGVFEGDRESQATRCVGELFGRGPSSETASREARPEDYSVQQDEYRRELDYDRRRAKRRTLRARLKTLAMVVIVPLGLIVVFLASYSLTCILNGATPGEIVQHLSNLYARLSSAIQTAFPPS